MIVHAITLAMNILYRSVQAYGPAIRALDYLVPGVRSYFGAASMSLKGKNFNSKHFKKGDPLPPFTGTLRIYNMRYCPYAQRTVLVANAKQLDYEVVNINLVEKPEWLPTKSPLGKVPAIEIKDGVTVFESLVTSEYLDEVYSQRPLLAKDPLTRAKDKMLIEQTSPIHTTMFKSIRTPETVDDELLERFYGALDAVQKELVARGTTFLSGTEPGFVDYMIWPWFERLPSFAKLSGKIQPLDGKKYKVLLEYIANVRKDPAVSQYLISDDIYNAFFQSYRNNAPRYDFLDGK